MRYIFGQNKNEKIYICYKYVYGNATGIGAIAQ